MKFFKFLTNLTWTDEILELWVIKAVKHYHKIRPQADNILEIPPNQYFKEQIDLFKQHWKNELKNSKPRLILAVYHYSKRLFYTAVICLNVSHALNTCSYLIVYFIYRILMNQYSIEENIIIVVFSALCGFLAIISRKFAYSKCHLLTRMLVYIISYTVQKKTLKISFIESKKNTSKSLIINSITRELETIGLITFTLEFPGSIMKILACFTILIYFLGSFSLIGIGISLLHVPLIIIISKPLLKNKFLADMHSNERVSMIKSFIENIQLLKLYNWEQFFIKKINSQRKVESVSKKKFDIIRGLLQVLTLSGIFLSIFCTLVAFIYSGNSLNLGELILVFSSLYSLQIFLPFVMILALSTFLMISQAFLQIQKVLMLSEDLGSTRIYGKENSIVLADCLSIHWEKKLNNINTWVLNEKIDADLDKLADSGQNFELRNINFQLDYGELMLVTGKIGSGKSTLLYGLLGELNYEAKSLKLPKSIAYFSENSWLIEGTIRENIVMGREFDEERYWDVIKSCCIEKDIMDFPEKDLRNVGDRGVTLSGGQKVRVCMARTMYSIAELYIFDDFMGSLDSNVAKQVFENCIRNMLAGKTRIVVVRNTDFCQYADKIMLLQHNTSLMFYSLHDYALAISEYGNNSIIYNKVSSSYNDTSEEPLVLLYDAADFSDKPVTFSTYFSYFLIGMKSWLIFVLLVIAASCTIILYLYFYYYSSKYVEKSPNSLSTNFYLLIVLGLYLAYLLAIVPLTHFLNKSNLKIHNIALKTVGKLHTRVFEFDSVQILNKFTKDINVIDSILVPLTVEFTTLLFPILGSIICIMIIQPIIIAPVFLFAIEFFMMSKYVLPICNALKKLELTSKAPIVHVSSSILSGLSSIRGLNLKSYFKSLSNAASQESFRASQSVFYFNDFYINSLECGIMIITLGIIILLIIMKDSFDSDISLLIVAVLFGFHGIISTFFFDLLNFDSCMLSVQNLFSIKDLEKERNDKHEHLKISNGKIKFDDVYVKYGKIAVLSGFSCKIPGSSKVAIIGRTGAGKSTIFQILLRLTDIHSGSIFIDKQNLNLFNPEDIRKHIAVNPQTSVVFYGSIADNLDPLKCSNEKEILRILEKLKLSHIVNEGLYDESFGKNAKLSAGELQMFNLARMLLKKSKIVLIDEGMSSMDLETQKISQKVLDKELKDATVLVISHEFRDLSGFDYVLAVDAGRIMNFAKP